MVQVLKGSNIVTAEVAFSDLINRNRLNKPSTGELGDADIFVCLPSNFKGAIITCVFDILFPNLNMHWKCGRVRNINVRISTNVSIAGDKKTVYIFNFLEDEKFIADNAKKYSNLTFVNMKRDDILSNLLMCVGFKTPGDCDSDTKNHIYHFIKCAIKYLKDKESNIFSITHIENKTFFMLDVYIRVYGLSHFIYNFAGKVYDMFNMSKVKDILKIADSTYEQQHIFKINSELFHILYGATVLHSGKIKYSVYTTNGDSSLDDTRLIIMYTSGVYIYNILGDLVSSGVKLDSLIVVDLENSKKAYFIDNNYNNIVNGEKGNSVHGDIIRSVVNLYNGVNKGIPHINVSTVEEVASIISAYKERMTTMSELKKLINKMNLYIITKVVRAVAFYKYDEDVFVPHHEARNNIDSKLPYCIYRDVVFPDIGIDSMNGFRFSGDKELRIRLLDAKDNLSGYKNTVPQEDSRITFYGGVNIVDNDTGTIFLNLTGHEGTEKYMAGSLRDYECIKFPNYIIDSIAFLFDGIRDFESNIVAKFDTHYYNGAYKALYENGEYKIGSLKVKLDLTKLPKTLADANHIVSILESKKTIEAINETIPGLIIEDSVILDIKPATYDAIMDLSDIK